MKTRTSRRGKAFGLLGAMLFLLIATSFHSAADNDMALIGTETRVARPSALPAGDTCAASTLDGTLSARPSVAVPVGIPAAVESVAALAPVSPFVAPRASVDSRPPPPAA